MQHVFRSPALRWMLMLLLLAGAFFSIRQTAYACSCVPPRPVGEELSSASSVFAGNVIQMQGQYGPGGYSVTFRVSEVWKGPVENRITLRMSSGLCDYTFVQGQEYLVYAYGAGGDLTTNICWRTMPLSQAGQDLAYLGPGQQPELESASPFLSTGLLVLVGVIIVALIAVIAVGMRIALGRRRRRA